MEIHVRKIFQTHIKEYAQHPLKRIHVYVYVYIYIVGQKTRMMSQRIGVAASVMASLPPPTNHPHNHLSKFGKCILLHLRTNSHALASFFFF